MVKALSLVVGGVAVAVGTTANEGNGTNADGTDTTGDSVAQVNVEFREDSTAFDVKSTKDISFVSINNNSTFTYEKFEDDGIRTEDEGDRSDLTDFSWSGKEELKSIMVKSGSTSAVFDCPEDDGAAKPGAAGTKRT